MSDELKQMGFPGGIVVKNPPANAGDARDTGLFPGWERSTGGGNGNLLQYSCLENSMDRGVWWLIVHRVANSWTRLSSLTMVAGPGRISFSLFLFATLSIIPPSQD